MDKKIPDQYRVLSLFSGGMGLDLGLHRTGRFRTVACIEKEPAFCETIRTNRDAGRLPRDLKVFEEDISQLDPGTVMDQLEIEPNSIDLIVGGPPCQSFSTAGRRKTTQDPRGTLLWDFLRFIEYVKPPFFLMENVRGLISAALKHRPIAKRPSKGGTPLTKDEEPGSVVRLFAKDLTEINGGYHLDIFLVNAVNYGTPQLRERALFFGNIFGRQIEFPLPTHGPSKANKQLSILDTQKMKQWRTLGDALKGLEDPNPQIMDFSPRKKKYLDMVPEGSNWRSLPEKVQKESMGRAWYAKGGRSGWWRRLTFDLPCPTLVTMPNHASTALCHPRETRALSIREYARIQEFEDDWCFKGTLTQQYAQVGNAVPVRLGQIAGGVIAQEIDQIISNNVKPSSVNIDKPRIVYIQSHVRTRKWYKNGETYVWKNGRDNNNTLYAKPKTIIKKKEL